MIHEMNDGKISDTKFADFSEAKKQFMDNLNKVSTQYMVVRNQYMKLSFWNKWMTQEGRDLGGALRDTKKAFTKLNENIEHEFGKKAVDNISEAIHKSADQILDRDGAREFHQATESIRQQITVSLEEYDDIKEEINDDIMNQRDFVKKAYKEELEPIK